MGRKEDEEALRQYMEASRKEPTPSKPLEQPEEWPQPIPFDDVDLPSFPVQDLPKGVREYVLAVAESMQIAVDMVAVAALTTAALCSQRKFVIRGKLDWHEPLNLYAAIVALPAERKSAAMAAMTRLVLEYEQEYNRLIQDEISRNAIERNVLAQQVKDLEEKAAKGKASIEDAIEKKHELDELPVIKPLRLWTDDATTEAVTTLMAENDGRTAVVSAEGGIFETLNGRYTGGVNIDVFLKAHPGDPIRVDRKGRASEYIPHPALTVLLAIQPVVLDGIMNNGAFRGRGLTARFLYSIPRSPVGHRVLETTTVPKAAEDEFRRIIFGLLDIPLSEQEHVITLSDEAYRIFSAFFDELEPRLIDDLEAIGDWAGKLHGATLRIAGVLHTVQHQRNAAEVEVSEETMGGAIRMGRYFLEHAKAAYMLMGTDERTNDAKYVLRQLEKGQHTKISRRDILRLCRRFKILEDMLPALDILVEHGYIRPVEVEYKGTGRKPDTMYIINPKAYVTNVTNVPEVPPW